MKSVTKILARAFPMDKSIPEYMVVLQCVSG